MTSSDIKPTLISQSKYGSQSRDLNQLIDDLRSLGGQLEVPLPVIGVIGNQSSGKSSLVEAISGIKVPRASGTCTRCPFEVRLGRKDTGPWTCQVKLRFERDGKPVREQIFGPPILEPIEVEERLRRAQAAILNPHLESLKFLEDADVSSEVQGLSFSPDSVCVEISGPDVVDLTFIDLPGIISNGESEEISLINSLVDKHICAKCIILLTLTMRDDLENQSAAAMARKVDSDGSRTIGVLTKPDTLQPGEETNWLKIIKGENLRHRLSSGYYVTRLPGPADVLNSLDDVRGHEKLFFDNKPWSSLPMVFRARLGVPSLAQTLSDKLSELIRESLPDLMDHFYNAHLQIEEELAQIPSAPSGDAYYELQNLLNAFVNQLKSEFQGTTISGSLWTDLRKSFKDFKRKTGRKMTVFCPHPSSEASHKCVIAKELGFWFDMDHKEDAEGLCSELARRFDILHPSDISSTIELSTTRELPNQVPNSVIIGLTKRPVEYWKKASRALLHESRVTFKALAEKIAEKEFSSYRHTGLLPSVLGITLNAIDQSFFEMKTLLEQFLIMDSFPYTQNNDLEMIKNRLLKHWSGKKSSKEYQSQDPAEQDLTVPAEVAAYQIVAWKRLIDQIPLFITNLFLQPIPDKISRRLHAELELNSTERCGSWLSEPVERTQLRQRLTQKEEMLNNIKNRLQAFERSFVI